MKKILLTILIILMTFNSYAQLVTSAKAIVSVAGATGIGRGQVGITLSISTGDQQILTVSMPVNLLSSSTQINNDIKDFARNAIIADGGPSYSNQDIIVFGGAS